MPSTPAPRLRSPVRDHVRAWEMSLDQMLPPDHPARSAWAFAEGMDLSPLYAAIKAVEGRPGHPHIDPRLLFALWLYATLDGVGSARELERLCADHAAYRWLCGGVSVNYHTLAAFRVAHPELLDGLLTRSVAALVGEGVVRLDTVAQDGLRVRASAGADSFRRRPTLTRLLAAARAHVRRLVTPKQTSDGKVVGVGNARSGNAWLKWAFSEAAVLSAQKDDRMRACLARLQSRHGGGKGLSIFAHKLGRVVYHLLRAGRVFDVDRFVRS